jgi:hypothetical protein
VRIKVNNKGKGGKVRQGKRNIKEYEILLIKRTIMMM